MKFYALALIFASLATFPLVAQRGNAAPDQIRIVAVNDTPEPETVVAVIQLPHAGDVVEKNPVWVQVRVDGFSLGSDSPFDRKGEIANSSMGQTIHVVIDNEPYFAINGPSIQPFNEEGFYYNQSYKFEVPYKLKDGVHTIRIFPARSYGESLKGERTYYASYFFVGKETNKAGADVLSRPYLTYNEPSDQMQLSENRPVLLDFYITNCELSADGYKVRLTIDGKIQRTFVSWHPYYVYGLKKGKHTMRLELLDEKNKVFPGPYNDVQHTIVIN